MNAGPFILLHPDVNAKDEYLRTPLHHAAQWNHRELVKILIENGADANAKDKEFLSPLHYAEENNNEDIASVIRKHGGR